MLASTYSAQRMVAEAESAPWLDSAAGGCCGRRCGRPQHHGGQPQPCVGFTAVKAHPWDLRKGMVPIHSSSTTVHPFHQWE
jgi:hypothetical protein